MHLFNILSAILSKIRDEVRDFFLSGEWQLVGKMISTAHYNMT